jgi:hypothetical protein
VSPESLDAARLLRNIDNPVAVLGRGEIKKALKVRVHRVSKSAQAKIEAAGGRVELIGSPNAEPVEKKKPKKSTKSDEKAELKANKVEAEKPADDNKPDDEEKSE